MEYGVWSMEYGVWSMEYGVWSMEYGAGIGKIILSNVEPGITVLQ
jgi:hypothetical protein